MYRRIGEKLSEGENKIITLGLDILPGSVHPAHELRDANDSIVPQLTGHHARMPVSTPANNFPEAQIAPNASYNPDGQCSLIEDWTLLDVQFHERAHPRPVE